MRMFIEWRDEWLLGIPRVDGEHLELARLFNRAAESFSCVSASDDLARGREVIGLLQEFGDHVRIHFENEETLMRDSGYPDFENRRYEHATLQAEYTELLRELDEEGLGCLNVATLGSLKTWLIGHIANADIRFGEFYRDKARSGEIPCSERRNAGEPYQRGRKVDSAVTKASGSSL